MAPPRQSPEHGLRIGALARAAGVKLSTLRFYERRRLLLPAVRTTSGQRLYGPEAATRVRFIRRAQELGFTLREVSAFLSVSDGRSAPTPEVTRFAEEKVRAIEARIEDLRRMRRAIEKLLAEGLCATDTVCPIQAALGGLPKGVTGSPQPAPSRAAPARAAPRRRARRAPAPRPRASR